MANLSDKALGVFAFAAYHQLTSGGHVSEVILNDASGHKADPQAVEELSTAGLLTVSGDRGAFTDKGQAIFEKALSGLRSAVG